MYIRVLEEISRHLWAISQPAIDAIIRIVTVGEEFEERSIFHGSVVTIEDRKEQIEAAAGKAQESYRYSERHDNLGIIHVDGPIISRAAGQSPSQPELTTTSGLMADWDAMQSNKKIDRIAMIFDTPGGAVTLGTEFASMISSSKKPVVAYVEGMAASLGYLFASHCDAIVASNTANLGSVGVVAKIDAGRDKDMKKFVSTQSPLKHADPTTAEGSKSYQRIVDDMADVIINSVASARGTNREDVMENYGKGSVVIAARAEAKGMIDAVMTRKQFLKDFSGDLVAGCGWYKKGKSRKTAQVSEPERQFDSIEKVSTQSNSEEAARAETNEERTENMNLEELLTANPEAKRGFDAAISKAKEEARTAMRTELKQAADVASGDEYPLPVRKIAGEVIKGEKAMETLDAVMTVAEMEKEKKNSTAAKEATKTQGDTPPDVNDGPSNDGKIRNTADYYRAIGVPMPTAKEVN